MSDSESSSLETVVIPKSSHTGSTSIEDKASKESPPDETISQPLGYQQSASSQISNIQESPLGLIPEFTSKNKPSWATGDPFFDTMAGLESTECRKYYINTSPETIQSLESVTAAMDIAEKPSNKENISDTPSSDDSIGLDHWNRTREKWTQGRWHVVPSANSNNPALNAIHPGNHDAIYDSLVYDHKRLSKPIPLPLVIKVLVSGWKRDGFWPETSVPGFTPSSVPTVNAYVPGFSSTNSQPVTRKS